MIETILAALSPFILNAVMGIVKWTGGIQSTGGKRFLLAVFSLLGVVAYSSLTGSPVDMNSVTSLAQTAVEALIAFLMAHGSYTLFWNKPAKTDVTADLMAS